MKPQSAVKMSRSMQLVCVVLVALPCNIESWRTKINVAYYELSPYIYRGADGSISGIFPEIIKEMSRWCHADFEYTMNTRSGENFTNLIENRTKMKEYIADDWLWLPLTQHISHESKVSLDFFSANILNSGIDVLVHRDQVGPLATMKAGLFECRYLFLIGLTLSIIFGMLIWFIERWNNREFSVSSCGILNGFWFGIVTMTTVGYGDIAPKSVFGKLITILWMVTGLTLTAVLTSTMTNVFAGLDHLEMGGKQVAALDRSLEASILSKYTSNRIKYVKSYELLFEGLIKKDFDVVLVDRYVRINHRSNLGDLRLVKKLSDVSIQWLFIYDIYNHHLRAFHDCTERLQLTGLPYVTNKYKLANERPNSDINMIEFFSEPQMLTISILAAALILFGILFETKLIFCRFIEKKSESAKINEEVTESQIGFRAKNESYPQDLQQVSLKDDLNTLDRKVNALTEDISSIKAMLLLFAEDISSIKANLQ